MSRNSSIPRWVRLCSARGRDDAPVSERWLWLRGAGLWPEKSISLLPQSLRCGERSLTMQLETFDQVWERAACPALARAQRPAPSALSASADTADKNTSTVVLARAA